MTPFSAYLTERAAKSFAGGTLAYLFQWSISNFTHFDAFERGMTWAAGTTACSIGFSVISRQFGRRGTASMTRTVEYQKKRE